MEALNITNLTANVNNIQGLSDRPNTADGLTAQQLKEKFDKAGSDIKQYINLTQNDEIETYMNNVVKPTIEAIQNGEKYSTTEVKTNKVWINGKPIYRTVVPVNFGNSGTTRIITAHNIANIDEITHYELRWYDTTDSCWYCNFKDLGTQYYIYMGNVSKTNVMVFQNSYNWQIRTRDRYCTIEYTKTTD